MRARARARARAARHLSQNVANTKTDMPDRARDVRSCSFRPGQICKSIQSHTQIRRQSLRDQGVLLTRALTIFCFRFTFLPALSSQSCHFFASALLAPSLSFSCSCYCAVARWLLFLIITGAACRFFVHSLFACVCSSLSFVMSSCYERIVRDSFVCDRVHSNR